MEYSSVIIEKKEDVAVIRLNRPDKYNAISAQLIKDLMSVINNINAGGDVRALIITGGGEAFCAGADIAEIKGLGNPLAALDFVDTIHDCFYRLESLPFPVIAAVNGLALGGGCELSLACDLRLASENAVFGLPEVKIGVLPGGGGTQRLPRIVGLTKAKELLFTGKSINALEAKEIGLVNKVVSADQLLVEAEKTACDLAKLPKAGLWMIKRAVNEGIGKDLRTAIEVEKKAFAILFSTADQKEGINAFIEKRKPKYRGL